MEPVHLRTPARDAPGQPDHLSALARQMALGSYDKLSAREMIALVSCMSADVLTEVLQYERRHRNRKTVLAALRRGLNDAG